MIFFATIGFAQEDCTNGIDDDGDGLIDLLDEEDCICGLVIYSEVIGDFEDYDCCPQSWTIPTADDDAIHCLNDGWGLATYATADYFNTCGYIGGTGDAPVITMPIPSGQGAVGFITTNWWHEYVGVCLENPMINGEVYNLSFYVGFNSTGGFDSDLDITINLFGTEDCDDFPIDIDMASDCLSNYGGWELISAIPALGVEDESWLFVSTSFVANMNAEAIAFGLECSASSQIQYHFLDNIQFTGNFFNIPPSEELVESGNCIDGVTLEMPNSSGPAFQWFLDGIAIPGATTNPYVITDASAVGEYQLMVIYGNGCTVSNSIDIQIDADVVEIDGIVTEIQCIFNEDGMIDISTNTTNTLIEYEWSNGSTSEDILEEGPGIYTVTVTDAYGCFGIESFVIPEPTTVDATITGDCVNGVFISIEEIPIATYQWYHNGVLIPGAVSNPYQITSDFSGVYHVFATNGTICKESYPLNIDIDNEVLSLEGDVVDLLCSSLPTGSINVVGNDMNLPLTYEWSNGEETQEITDLEAGTYTVTVTDANGCFGIMDFTVETPPPFIYSATYQDTICANDINTDISFMVSGGSPPYTYLWNTGSTNDTIFGVGPGLYSIEITDSLECTILDTFVIDSLPLIEFQFETTDAGCNGEQNGSIDLTINTGLAPFTILWSNDSISEDLIDIAAGWYSITLTDSYGCTINDSVHLNENSGIEVIEIVNAVNCRGEDDGSILLEISEGQSPYAISWSNGEETATIENLSPGFYEVTIVDEAGCTWLQNYDVMLYSEIIIDAEIIDNQCFDGATASIELTIENANSPYSILWEDGSSEENRYNLAASDYSYSLVDSFGCVYLDSFILTEGIEITYQSIISQPGCNGSADGLVNISPVTGAFPVSFEWSNGETVNQINDLTAGTYFLTITDDNDCVKLDTFLLSENSDVEVTESIDHNPCYEDSDGSINLDITGGNQPYDILWSNAETSADISSLPAGDYFVTIVDANDCTSSYLYSIFEPDSLHIEDFVVLPLCHDDIGQIGAQGNGGTSLYTFLWSTGETNQVISISPGNTYKVTMTDMNLCTKEKTYVIDDILEIDIVTTSIIDPGTLNNDGSITIDVSGGTPPYNITWDNGQTGLMANGVGVGSYTATVVDANNCTQTITIELFNEPISFIGLATDNLCFGDCLGQIELTIEGGSEPYTISWSDGQFGTNPLALCNGEYQATIIDGIGEESITELYIINSPSIIIIDGQAYDISCVDMDDGSIVINPDGGEEPFDYNWSNTMSGDSIGNLSPGEYSVTVMDNNGCSESSTYNIEDIQLIEIDIETLPFDCENPLGTIIFNGENTYDYPYFLNGNPAIPNNQNEITDLEPGTYQLSYSINETCVINIEAVIIQEKQEIDFELSDIEFTVFEGEEIALTLIQKEDTLLSNLIMDWNIINSYDCTKLNEYGQCIEVLIFTLESEIVKVVITDQDGCETIFEAKINVEERETEIYLPNIFSPNDDGLNDEFTINSNDDEVFVNYMHIYDRWGNLVFIQRNKNLQNLTSWRGEFNGKKVAPNVFVYMIEVVDGNGEIKVLFGDLAVVY